MRQKTMPAGRQGFSTIIIIILVILVVLGAAGYFAFSKGYISLNIPGSTPKPILTPAPYPINTKPPEETPSDPNIKTFTSQTLGISFQYNIKPDPNGNDIAVKEQGDKVYVYFSNMSPTSGQFVEVFQKDPNDTLAQAITKKVMAGYSSADCVINPMDPKKGGDNYSYPATYSFATINLPASTLGLDPEQMQPYYEKCPKGYISYMGIAYFVMDSAHPSKFVFFSIGQYAINVEPNVTWQDTIKFLD